MTRISQLFTTKPLLLLTTGVCIGIVATVVLTLFVRPHAPKTINQKIDAHTSESPLVSHPSTHKSPSSPDIAQAEALNRVISHINVALEQKHSFDRTVALYALVSPLENDTLQDLLHRSMDMQWLISSSIRKDLQTVLIERLVSINPRDAIATVVSVEDNNLDTTTSLMSILVDSMQSAPEREGANPLDQGSQTLASRVISKKYSHLPFKEQKELTARLDPETRFMRFYIKSMTDASDENPNLIWPIVQDIVQDDYTYISQIIDLMTQWYDSQGMKVLDHMHATMSRDEIDEIVATIVLEHVASKHPKLAFEYVTSQVHHDKRLLAANEVIRKWATQNPSAALTAVNDLHASAITTDLQLTAVCSWATKDPDYVLENLSDFPPHTHIDAACDAIGTLAAYSPNRAIEWLVPMKDVKMQYPATNTLVSVWSKTDLGAAYQWVLEEPAIESFREKLYEPIAYLMTKTDPTGALELARKHPLASGQVGLEASIFREIAFQDMQIALELLPHVRSGQKNFAYGAVGSVYVQTGQFQKAVDLGLELGESAHANYFQYISYIWVNTDPHKLYTMLPDLPIEEARSKAAYALCVLNDGNSFFTEKQIEALDQYLSVKDRETLGSLAPSKN